MKRPFLFILLALTHYANAQKVNSYDIDVTFFPEEASMWGYPVSNASFMKGQSIITFETINADSLSFYLHGELKIDSIYSGKNKVSYISNKILYYEDYSLVALKTNIKSSEIVNKELTVYYSGFMNPSRARSLSDYMRINIDEGVFLRAKYYSPWFPLFQEPNEDEYPVNFKKIQITTPSNLKTIISGKLINETCKGITCTTIWYPGRVSTTDIQCTAREYKILSKNGLHVFYTDNKDNGAEILTFTQKLKEIYSSNLKAINDTTAHYIIEMPEYGNISSQNVIGISTDVYENFKEAQYSKLTIAHELVHPFVSIPVEKDKPFAALVIEGFPSFFHLYGMKKIESQGSSFDLQAYMKRVEESYLSKKNTGTDRRGNKLPKDKPILKITFDEIGEYKDLFILSDRVRLFLYALWVNMGDKKFDAFLGELFKLNGINYQQFEKLITKYIPDYQKDLNIWLNSSEYPDHFHLGN